MAIKKSAVPFAGTVEQERKLLDYIDEHKSASGSLMRILQEAQGIYGYLPIEVQKLIAEELNVPLEKVYGVVTFYSQFSLNPKGKYKISVCLGTACYVKGSGGIFEKLQKKLAIPNKGITPDGKFSLEDCRCIGACGLAPVLTVNDDVYGRLTGDELDDILAKYTA
ncbi:MAG: NAD(P)H-dependent oxidoreductase subunit E [Oscillospiraceae bacterium]|jgi:NADP-reducing hydrogenase subunit HndA|nr:NAD(P)H-dependent oxidoreductase subunit E [Oscillospiraceae bacterium]